MILATSYPFLEVFWTMLIFFAFVVWIWILFTVLADIFRRHDTSGFCFPRRSSEPRPWAA